MKQVISNYLNLVFRAGIAIVILSSLLLFTNLFTDFYEIPKLAVLVVFTGILLILLAVRFTVMSKFVFIRTPLDLPLLLLLAVGIISTVLSPAPYVSLLGNQLQVSTSLVALVSFVLFYFVVTNSLKSAKDIKIIIFISLGAAAVLSAVTLLAYMGLTVLPKPWTHGLNFTPTGSTFATTAILALLLPLTVAGIISSQKVVSKSIYGLLLALFAITIALTGVWATWIAAAFGVVLTFWVSNPKLQISRISPISLISLIGPIIVIALIVALSFIPPLGKAQNPFYTQAKNFPREIQLNFVTSWKISASSFRDSPFWGSGPSTYLFDFTSYKPVEFNSTKSWNLRFDRAFNEYLQTLATLGGIGLIALLSLTALFVSSAYRILKNKHLEGEKLGLAISGLTFFVILAGHPSSLIVWIMGLIILAAFFVVTSPNESDNPRSLPALSGILVTIAFALTLTAFFFGGKFVLADYHHRLALNAVAANSGVAAYNELVAAEKLNPLTDLYRTDLAQTNFALASAIAQAKAPNEASPGGYLTDQDKQNIQVLLQQSISEGRSAVALSPRSAINWEILAQLYRQMSGVTQNALLFAQDAYGRAILQDPLNPQLRLNVGGIYYSVKNYDLAIRFFTDAINLKPDFANAYYNLSVVLRDKGDLNGAQTTAEKVLTLVDASSPDYKVVSDYLADLKNRIASGSASESQIQPPAVQTGGALQGKELPKVINLPQPEKIATPEAIKKTSPTP